MTRSMRRTCLVLAAGLTVSCSVNQPPGAASTGIAPALGSDEKRVTKKPVPAPGTVQAPERASEEFALDSKCAARQVLFDCSTANRKRILLCDEGDELAYSFGKLGDAPELVVRVPREQATSFQWQGIGRWINYSVGIPNGATLYTVYTSADRISEDHTFEAGVAASVDGEEIARIRCVEPVEHRLEGVDLKLDR